MTCLWGVYNIIRKCFPYRSTDFKGEYADITLLQSTENSKSDDLSAVNGAKESSLDTTVTSINEDTTNGDILSRGINLGPTNITEGPSLMDGGDASQWNTGGAISVKDKVPPVISSEGEQQIKTEKNRDNEIKDKDLENLSLASDIDDQIDPGEQHDKIIHTSTSTYSIDNEEGHPHNKDNIVSVAEDQELPLPIVRTESDQLTVISPTPSQITQHPKQDSTIQTTNMIKKEAEVSGSSTHAASAASPMPTNDLHQSNMANGFDAVNVVNGAQLVTAGYKAEESGAQVAAKDLPHGATNEGTSHVRLVGENATGLPAAPNASYAAPPDAIDAGKGGSISGVQTTVVVESQDKTISHGTDSSSHQPAVQGRDIPTQTMPTSTKGVQTSEADVSSIVAATCTDADCSATTEGDRQKTQSESAVSNDGVKNLDIISQSDDAKNSPTETKPDVLGSHSLHASSNLDLATMSYDEDVNQNSVLPSSSPAGSKRKESHVDRLESEGMIGMKSVGKGSLGDNQESTLMEDSFPSLSRSGTGESSGEIGDHHDKQRNGMNGMQRMSDGSDTESHTYIPTGSSHSSNAPDNNGDGDVTSDSSRRPMNQVTDDLPKTTDSDSSNVSRAYADNPTNGSPASTDSSHNAFRNVSLTENPVNASLSTQWSLTDTQPQANGSLANQNAGLGDEEAPVNQSSQTQHRNDSDIISSSISNGASPTQSQGQQGGTTVNQAQNSSIPPLSAGGGGGGGNGNGVGGHGVGSGGQVSTGRDREKSVFLRLSNQIQELEMNMSLFSSYLDRISTRLGN